MGVVRKIVGARGGSDFLSLRHRARGAHDPLGGSGRARPQGHQVSVTTDAPGMAQRTASPPARTSTVRATVRGL